MTDMHQGLDKFDRWMTTAIKSLSPARRKTLFINIGKQLRKSNQRRITAQTDPDGHAWEGRKKAPARTGKTGRIQKKKKMMLGLRQARRLKLKSNPSGTSVGYEGRNAKIAAVHQFGGLDTVAKDGPKVRYPIRQMLGFSKEDRRMIRRVVLDHVGGGWVR